MSSLYYLGIIVCFVGWLWLLISAFSESILWGLGSLFIPIIGLIFGITHWEKAKTPFLIYAAGMVLIFLGFGAMKAQMPAG